MKVVAIAVNTFREAVRNKILYSILMFAILVVCIAGMLGNASLGDPMKFAKDFTIAAITLCTVVIAIVLGVSMLHNELGKKTIFNILSKPVDRAQLILGKFLGLIATVTLILGSVSLFAVLLLAQFEGRTDWALLLATAGAVLELMIIVSVALFFSSIVVTPSLAGMFTIATFIAGRSAGYLQHFTIQQYPGPVKSISRVLYWVLPHLDRFNVADQVIYGEHFSGSYFIQLAAYTFAYSTLALLASVAIFSRREFH